MFHDGRTKQTARKTTGGMVGSYSMAGERTEDEDEDLDDQEDQDDEEIAQEVMSKVYFNVPQYGTLSGSALIHTCITVQPDWPIYVPKST